MQRMAVWVRGWAEALALKSSSKDVEAASALEAPSRNQNNRKGGRKKQAGRVGLPSQQHAPTGGGSRREALRAPRCACPAATD